MVGHEGPLQKPVFVRAGPTCAIHFIIVSQIVGAGLQKAARYGTPLHSTAQMIRAFLLATATVARLNPRRSRS